MMRKEASATSTERLQQQHNPSHVSALALRPCHRDEALPVRNGVLQRHAFCRGWEGTWGCCGQPFWCGSSKGLREGWPKARCAALLYLLQRSWDPLNTAVEGFVQGFGVLFRPLLFGFSEDCGNAITGDFGREVQMGPCQYISC